VLPQRAYVRVGASRVRGRHLVIADSRHRIRNANDGDTLSNGVSDTKKGTTCSLGLNSNYEVGRYWTVSQNDVS
jgi:hypothetical protein